MDAFAPPSYSAAATERRAFDAAQRLRCGARDDVRAALLAERARTLRLAAVYEAALGPSLAVPLAPGLNPPRWELGHVAWFEQWWIARNPQRHLGDRADPDAPRPACELAGADTFYDSSRVAHDTRWRLSLPSLDATRAWMAAVRAETLRLLDALPPDADDAALYFFRLACMHEAMHAEAACYMAHALGFEAEAPAPQVPQPQALPDTLRVAACEWHLGSAGPGFAFDNELQAHPVPLRAFEIDAQPVSWSRWQAFVQAGGHADRRWWSDEGWVWRQAARPGDPKFPQGPAPASHLSLYEAQAWCRWAGRRLPSEAQWECAALSAPGFDWGAVWEWTASAFEPFPGFRPHPYRDYSQPWFGTRTVLRGASAVTSACMAHPRYRNFFEPHRHDILAGFRSCA